MAKQLFKKKISLGYKYKDMPAVSTKKEKKTLHYPSMYINNTQLPLDGDDVGKTFNCNIKLKVNSFGLNTDSDGSKYNYSFDVMEISFAEGDK